MTFSLPRTTKRMTKEKDKNPNQSSFEPILYMILAIQIFILFYYFARLLGGAISMIGFDPNSGKFPNSFIMLILFILFQSICYLFFYELGSKSKIKKHD